MMNKSTLTGIVIGIVIASAGAVVANYTLSEKSAKSEIASTDSEVAVQDAGSPSLSEPAPEQTLQPLEDVAPAPKPKVAAVREEYQLVNEKPPAPTYAEVISVHPVMVGESVPREVCEQVPVTQQQPTKDENQILGTVAGAVIGGVLGNQVGGGSGKKIATVAGAVAGGYAGKKVQENAQSKNTTTTMETRCETVYDSTETVQGYDVAYRLGGVEGTVRMDRDPGDRIPVRNGRLVTE